ncbi:hypothetical protein NEUTE1DRAFT_144928 [Neurospora tetrasperma FGSC 2508]|uniref:Uncharacterized protein n=1 Tax=Neurospora tetrasperma (strain FGSC 2508 / ATCC MYA-4615 / P0657) TaxID=510951 RepID=F8MHH1_NEUT8|nr:uncharacterized protein NEUTE1DRAFT_144928 [Neurospora tetrasperma FGSC 2508]EGO58783.1 hypothetical protein NEUTE1DRAFT_144928 [Neurospora tetrasperma FGSC 2508]EGZ72881.1 hypothetical protein NEUTE2DRAFT_156467 [Neurospora tetrasperma FGSC 2509]
MSAQVNEVEQQPTVPSTTATTKPDDTGSASAPAPVPMEKEAATTTAESKPSAATDNLKPATDAHPDDKKDAEKPKSFPTVDEVVSQKMALEPTAAGSEFHGLESATPSAPTHTIFDPSPEKYHDNPRDDAVPPMDGVPESLIEEYISGDDDCEGPGTGSSMGMKAPDPDKAAKKESTEDKTEKKVDEAKEAAVTNPDEAAAAAPSGENGTNGVTGAAKKDNEGDKETKNIPSETAQAKEDAKAAPAPAPAPALAASKKRKADDFEEDYDDNEAEKHDAKKAKTEQANGNGAGADGAASPVKRAPGRPKKTEAAKVDKAARKILKPVGMTQRKTRSQGPP